MALVAFYTNGAIQPQVPRIIAKYPTLVLSDDTISDLDLSGKGRERRAAEAIAVLLAGSDGLTGSSHRLLLLSDPDDPDTFLLNQPVENTKTRGERPVAWATTSRTVRLSSLAHHPATTDELDALEQDHADHPAEAEVVGDS